MYPGCGVFHSLCLFMRVFSSNITPYSGPMINSRVVGTLLSVVFYFIFYGRFCREWYPVGGGD